MREIDRVVYGLKKNRPWADNAAQNAIAPLGAEEPTMSMQEHGLGSGSDREASGVVTPMIKSEREPVVTAHEREPSVAAREREPIITARERARMEAEDAAKLDQHPKQAPEPSNRTTNPMPDTGADALSAALDAVRGKVEAAVPADHTPIPLGIKEKKTLEPSARNASAPVAPPADVAQRVDPDMYKAAEERAARVFERAQPSDVDAPSDDLRAEQVNKRLSNAIEKEKQKEAERVSKRKSATAGLTATRDDAAGLSDKSSRGKSRNYSKVGSFFKAAGGTFVAGAAKTPQMLAAAGRAAHNGLKSSKSGAAKAATFIASGRITPKASRSETGAGAAAGATGTGVGSQASGRSGGDGRFGPILTGLGALCSVIFVIAVCIWTYKLGQRDAMEVPVVKAMAGDARIVPEDEGGEQVAHQGLAVNEMLDGGGVSSVADVVITAPRTRVLRDEDKPASELQALVVKPAPTEEPVIETEPETVVAATATADAASADPKFVKPPTQTDPEVVAKLADDATVSEEVAAVEPTLQTPPAPEEALQTTLVTTPSLSVIEPAEGTDGEEKMKVAMLPSEDAQAAALPPLMASLPRARPVDLSDAMAAAVDEALQAVMNEAVAEAATPADAQPATQEVAPGQMALNATGGDAPETIPLPSGTRMIQLGAFDTAATAREQWDRFSRLHSDLLSSKESYIQRINSSGRIFYRLRVAGYETKSDTRAACDTLSARGLPCITVTLP